jgi:hypothetical protein
MSDRDTALPGFDPRFDPAFQPGYDPLLHRPQSVFARISTDPLTASRDAEGRDAARLNYAGRDTSRGPDAGPDGVGPDAAGRDRGDSTIRAVAGTEHLLADDAFPTEDELSIHEPAPWWRRANPYLLALAALGVAFIVAGLFLANLGIEGVRNGFESGPGQDAYVAQMIAQIGLFGTPMLIVLGLATLTSVVGILAFRWTPSNR